VNRGSEYSQMRRNINPNGVVNDNTPLANFDALPEFLTAKELEEFLRIDVKTIYRYVQLGLIPYVRMQSNVRFSKHQVERWLRERNYQPQPIFGEGAKRQ